MKILLILFYLSFTAPNPPADTSLKCSDFRVGKFELINEELNRRYIIERDKNSQSEEIFNLETGEKIGNKKWLIIKWLSDCEYNLVIDTSKGEHDANDLYITSIGGVTTKITSIDGNCANISSTLQDQIFKDRLCKLR